MNYIASIFCTFIICHSPQKSSAAQKVYRAGRTEGRPVLVQPLSLTPFDSSPSRGASGEEAKLYGLPRPPLARGGGIASAMTERASPSPGSRHAAMGRLFVRAMLSLRLLFFVSVLALSVTFGDSSPKGGAIGRPGNFPLDAQGPIWRKRAGAATELSLIHI